MTVNLISRTKVKAMLGLTGDTYDDSIDAMIPIVSTNVREILNHQFDKYYLADYDSSSALLVITNDIYNNEYPLRPLIPVGTVVYGENIPDDTYIQSYDYEVDKYTLSATPTGEDDGWIYPTIKIAQWLPIARMVWWRIQQLTTTFGDDNVKSKKIGGTSWTYADVNRQWNYPQILINDLGPQRAKIG